MRAAFKEWAVIVDALSLGRQILVLRKGGIQEGRGGFQVSQPEFWLFPTLFHQQRESVLPAAQERFDLIAPHFPATEVLRLRSFAKVVAWQRLDSLAAAERLRGQHCWKDDVIAQRFEWGKAGIHALAVRVFNLATPRDLPMRSEYGGCKSWVELESAVSVENAVPALEDRAFAEAWEGFSGRWADRLDNMRCRTTPTATKRPLSRGSRRDFGEASTLRTAIHRRQTRKVAWTGTEPGENARG